jgi:hypothetical protein
VALRSAPRVFNAVSSNNPGRHKGRNRKVRTHNCVAR